MDIELTEEQRQALEQNHGFVRGRAYVLMSLEVFQRTLGDQTSGEFAASIEAIREALADLEAHRTISLEDAKTRLDAKYGVSG